MMEQHLDREIREKIALLGSLQSETEAAMKVKIAARKSVNYFEIMTMEPVMSEISGFLYLPDLLNLERSSTDLLDRDLKQGPG